MKRVTHAQTIAFALTTLTLAAPLFAVEEGLTRDVALKPQAVKAKAYAQHNAAFFTTLLGKPYLLTRFEFMGVNHRLELDRDFANANESNNFGVRKEVMLCYGACIKHEKKFTGGHKSAIGEEIGNALIALGAIPEYTYDEHPLVELYVKEVPMMWQLRSAQEFAAVRKSVETRLQELGVEPEQAIQWFKDGMPKEGHTANILENAKLRGQRWAITAPNAATKPLLFSDPHYTNVVLFKSFTSVFSNLFMKRALSEVKTAPLSRKTSVIGHMVAATAIAYYTQFLRELIAGYDSGMSPSERLPAAADRAP